MSIVIGGLGGNETSIILQGYGYVEVVIISPTPSGVFPSYRRPRPRIIRIPIKLAAKLIGLGLIKEYKNEVELHPLSLVKVDKIRFLLSELEIVLSEEVQIFLDELSVMSPKMKKISFKQLNMASEKKQFFTVKPLAIVEKIKEKIKISSLNLLARTLTELQTIPSDIYKIRIETLSGELKKHLELLELLEEIDKI